jgi:translocation and assembly module TamB
MADLGPLGAFLGRKMAGRALTDITLAAAGPRQDVSVRVEASGLAAGGAALAKADVTAAFTDVLRAPQGDLAVALSRIAAGGAAVESFDAKAHGGGKTVDFSMAAKGTMPEPFELATGGSFSPTSGGGSLRLDKLDATAKGLKLALVRPATTVFGPGALALDGLDLSLEGATITASGSLAPGRADFSMDVAALPLGMLAKAGLPPVSGTASATVRVTRTPAAPQIIAVVKLDNVAVPAAQGQNIPPANLVLDARIGGGRLTADCRVSAGPDAGFDFKAVLPAKLSLTPFDFALPADAALEGSLTGDVDLARIAAISGDEALSLSGILKADFTLAGRLSAPLVTGRASLADGQAAYVTTGTRLQGITLDLEAMGTKAVLNAFSARDAGKGSFSITGKADFSPQGGFPFEAAMVLDKLTPMRTDMVTATLSANVNAKGSMAGTKVKGGVNVGPVDVNIPESVPPNATPIPVEMTGQSGHPAQASTAQAKPYPVDLDVAVDFPGRIFVRGMGLESMWAGNLAVKGAADAPEVDGAVRIVKGKLDFFGKKFDLARGQVTFHGTKPPVPMLDIEATTKTGEMTASILVTGNAAHPAIDFSSDPTVSKDEILARVLFGQSMASLTPPQALQLAQAVSAMSGGGGSMDFLGATRKLTGLDYLGVNSNGQSLGQSTVSAGKYVADGVYVEASQGLAGSSGAVSVEVDVTKNVSVESKIGMDSKTGVGVNWKFDY